MDNTYMCKNCKYLDEQVNNKLFCTKSNKNVYGSGCDDFDKIESCNTCEYSKALSYETDTNNYIDYMCALQNNKVVYIDYDPSCLHNAKYPECILGMYEEKNNKRGDN